MWIYRSKIGTFKIIPNRKGRFDLWFDEDVLGSYHSPQMAADDVYTQSTGCFEWDSLDPVMEPADLSEWEYRHS
jgi:hypothetical protein